MLNFFRRLLKPKYETLNKIEIDSQALVDNFNYLKSCQPAAEIFPVLKSNAYGHGLKEVCTILNQTSAPMVVVDSYPEAQIVYRYFKRQVLILGEMPHRAYRYCRLSRTEFVVYNEETLRYLSRFGKKARVHLFANSGMNREGIKDLGSFIARNEKYLAKVEVTGLCSHFASADKRSLLNQSQLDNFTAALEALRVSGIFPRWVHIGNSAAALSLDDKLLTAFRPGLALYGYDPFEANDPRAGKAEPLRPALRVYSHIVSLQTVEAGESVSYAEDYHVAAPGRIAVIPFGYFEGLDRRLSNRAKFLVRNEAGDYWARIAGKVAMNLTCLDIGNREAGIGDIVEIVSVDPDSPNSIINLANLLGTIPYEVLVKIQANIRREVI